VLVYEPLSAESAEHTQEAGRGEDPEQEATVEAGNENEETAK
jgi:hypothetical protein